MCKGLADACPHGPMVLAQVTAGLSWSTRGDPASSFRTMLSVLEPALSSTSA